MAIVAIVGLAGYCMVCERLADNRRREMVRQARPVKVRPEPEAATPAIAAVGTLQPVPAGIHIAR
ncbi:MAG: hypothetical protein ACTHK4_16850 [Mycobacteriales bacterium]